MWPWELYEMLNLAAAVERAAEFDIIHYEAAYYPMSLAFTRLSPTPIVQTLHHSPSAGRSQAVVALSGGAVRRHLQRAGAPAARASTSSARCCTASTPTRSRSASSPTTTCCSSAASPKARACCRRSRSPRRAGHARFCSRRRKTSTTTRSVAPHVDGNRIVYVGEVGLRRRR